MQRNAMMQRIKREKRGATLSTPRKLRSEFDMDEPLRALEDRASRERREVDDEA
jgi:hypothetical protein